MSVKDCVKRIKNDGARACICFRQEKTLREIYFPAVCPYLSAAATTGLGFAWKSCVAAEVIALSKNSVGRALYESKLYLETAELFAWTASVVLISVLFENYLCINSLKIGTRKARPGGEARALNTGMQAVRPNCNINPMHMPNAAEMRNETYD